MNKTILTTLVMISLATLSSTSFGTEYQSPRTAALGGAGRAGPMLIDAIYLNPSYASFTPVYSMSADYTKSERGRLYNVSVQDSRTESFQAGAGYTKKDQNAALNIGASRLAMKQLGIGLGTKILFDNGTNNMTTDIIFSSSFIASSWMYSALIVDNIIEGSEKKARGLYRTIYPAFKFIPTQQVEVYVDPFYSPSYDHGKKAGYHAGLEFGLLADFFLRMGKFQNADIPHLSTHGNGFGWGFGWLGPKISIDYSMMRTLATDSGPAFTTANSFDLTIYI